MPDAHLPPRASSVIETIGHTPMVELTRLVNTLGLKGRLLIKLEYFNPGFSKKDRIALEIVKEAKTSGELAEGQPVVELTSGNTGTGLAIVCQALGHPFIAVMSRGNTIERARMMAALGAEVALVDQAPGSPPNQVSGEDLALVEQKARALTMERGAFRADQFNHRGNLLAHERHTGPELWQQSGGAVDCFVDFVGSAGSFTGVMKYLMRQSPDIRGYLVEPEGAAVLAGQPVTQSSHRIQGGGYSMEDLSMLDRSAVTGGYRQVTDEQATEAARLLAREEGIFAGYSSGANLAAAIELLKTDEENSCIALLACDSGLKYLSTDLYPEL